MAEIGINRESFFNTADKFEEEDIEDQIRATVKKDNNEKK